MPMPLVHHAFLQGVTPSGCEERSFLDGRVNDIRTRPVAAPYVVRRRSALEIVRSGVGWVLKNAARLVYLAPALLVIKLAIHLLVDRPTSDLVIVAFVGIVGVFFALLNVYIVVSILWWLLGRGAASVTLKPPFDQEGREARLLLPGLPHQEVGTAPPPIGQFIRTRGTIVRLGPNREGDGTVLCDLWAEGRTEIRLTEAIDFAVVGQGRMPVVVRLTDAPLVLAKPAPIRLDAYASQVSAGTTRLIEMAGVRPSDSGDAECSLLKLREGDEVEVIGAVTAHINNVDGFELEGTYASIPLVGPSEEAGSPFRDKPGGAGLILGSASGAPILIRHCTAP